MKPHVTSGRLNLVCWFLNRITFVPKGAVQLCKWGREVKEVRREKGIGGRRFIIYVVHTVGKLESTLCDLNSLLFFIP